MRKIKEKHHLSDYYPLLSVAVSVINSENSAKKVQFSTRGKRQRKGMPVQCSQILCLTWNATVNEIIYQKRLAYEYSRA